MRVLPRRAALPVLIVLFGLFPVPLSVALLISPSVLPVIWGYTVCTFLCTYVLLTIDGKKRMLPACFCLLLLWIHGFLFLDWHNSPVLIVLPVLFSAELLHGIRPSVSDSPAGLPFFIFCLVLYALLQFAMITSGHLPLPWSVLTPSLQIGFLLFLLSVLLVNNQEILQNEIRFGRTVPHSLLKVNRLNIFLVLGLSALFACLPQISTFLGFLYDRLKTLLHLILIFISGLFARETVPAGDSGPFSPPGFFADEMLAENPTNPILELLANIITGIVIAIFVIVLLFQLGKQILRLFRFLVKRFQQYIGAFEHTYVDTYEDLPDSDALKNTVAFRKRSGQFKKAGTPRERIRLLYQHRLRRHPEWAPGDTAAQHLIPDAAHLYEKARYSQHDISSLDADTFSLLIKSSEQQASG